jgi:hypothetical protein
MRIILTNEENAARLRNPKSAVVVCIHGSDGIARVAAYPDVSGKGVLEKAESEIQVEVENLEEQPIPFPLNAIRKIILAD